jgi:hypothetical protein
MSPLLQEWDRPTAEEELQLTEPLDLARPAAGNDVITARVDGDAGARFTIDADGRLEWGAGGGALDVNLYRNAAGPKTDQALLAGADVIAWHGNALATKIGMVGPSLESGIAFGSGADTNLYRGGADLLRTDDQLSVSRPAAGSIAYMARFAGNAVDAFVISAAGTMSWGDGALSRDTNLYRNAAGILKSDGGLQLVGNLRVNEGVATLVRAGAYGPGAEAGLTFGSANDVNLYRESADRLATQDTFRAERFEVQNATGSGYVNFSEQSSDPTAPGANQARLFVRDDGGGKTQLCVRFNTGAVQVLATEP